MKIKGDDLRVKIGKTDNVELTKRINRFTYKLGEWYEFVLLTTEITNEYKREQEIIEEFQEKYIGLGYKCMNIIYKEDRNWCGGGVWADYDVNPQNKGKYNK